MTSAALSSTAKWLSRCRKIVAVGRNYRDHAAELGNAVPSQPLIFMKPSSCLITEGHNIEIPLGCQELHHEVELGVVINGRCQRVSEQDSMNYVAGYALALDMTARDFQNAAKKKGHPWTMAKCFDTSCPVGVFVPASSLPDPHNIELVCKVNGEVRQRGSTADMIFNIPTLISHISKYFTLEEGDLVLTGTPAGVGPVRRGDVVQAEMQGSPAMTFNVVQRE